MVRSALATAEDGIHFQKYEGNPILSKCPEGMRQNDFRDTKVWKRGKKWYLTAGTDGRKIRPGGLISF